MLSLGFHRIPEWCGLIFMRFSQAHPSVCPGLSGCCPFLPGVLTAPHSLVLSANLPRVQLIPLSMSPTRAFNTCGTSAVPYRSVLGHQAVDQNECGHPANFFSSWRSTYQIHVSSLETRKFLWDSVMLCTKFSCSFLIHHCCNSVVEGHSICQAWFAFSEAIYFIILPRTKVGLPGLWFPESVLFPFSQI